MNTAHSKFFIAILALAPLPALAFNSGSTGADGPLSPSVNTTLQVPDSGVFNFTTVNIPSGVTLRFIRNTANTPVVILASGNVSIAGTVDVGGGAAAASGSAGDGFVGDDGLPGAGGPGGYDGGRGGAVGWVRAGAGLGPGAGAGGHSCGVTVGGFLAVVGGAGGGFGAAATSVSVSAAFTCSGTSYTAPAGGVVYGGNALQPIVGGSGGGGAGGGSTFAGGGGGGGGGALLIAASGTVDITGSVLANGGSGGATGGSGAGAAGGGGSGGAIRIVASAITGNGTISASGGAAGAGSSTGISTYAATAGATGRIRLESEAFGRTAATTPAFTFASPGSVFVTGSPALRIVRVGGIDVPIQPTGSGDVVLPSSIANPVSIEVAATGVPPGSSVKVTVTPAAGVPVSASATLSGATDTSASVSVTIPSGPSVLSAQTSYTIVASLGDALSRYANNERVERVRLDAVAGGAPTATLITVSGKEFRVDPALLTAAGG